MTEPVARSLHEHDIQHVRQDVAALDRFLIEKIDAVDRRHTELREADNKATEVALTAQKEKAQAHNELLTAMKDQQAKFYTKEQADTQTRTFDQRINALERHQVADQSKDKTIGMSASAVVQLLVAATLIISIVVFFANWGTAK